MDAAIPVVSRRVDMPFASLRCVRASGEGARLSTARGPTPPYTASAAAIRARSVPSSAASARTVASSPRSRQ